VKSPEQKIAEIRRPPSVANWVRLNARRRDETAKRITRFVLSKPRHALAAIYRLIADYVTLAVTAETVNKGLSHIADPLVRKLGREILSQTLPWLEENEVRGIEAFHDSNYPFPIGRGIIIPVKPTFVYNKDGRLTPVFIVGWSSIPFDDFQKRLFGAVIQRAILTQEGFEDSDALVLFVPRIKNSKSERRVHPMWVRQLEPMSDAELAEQFDRFGNALDDAVPIIFEELAKRGG
jgi:hypothetical protein